MIFGAILWIFYWFIWLVIQPLILLPDVTANEGVGLAIAQGAQYLKNLDVIIPVDNFLTIIVLLLSIESAVALYKLIMWIVRRIPGQG